MLCHYISKASKSCNYVAYPTKTKQFSKPYLKVVKVTFIIKNVHFILMELTTVHQMSLAHNPLHVCKILDTTGPMHFHSDKSKAHLISHFTADAFNVPLVTFNIFN